MSGCEGVRVVIVCLAVQTLVWWSYGDVQLEIVRRRADVMETWVEGA